MENIFFQTESLVSGTRLQTPPRGLIGDEVERVSASLSGDLEEPRVAQTFQTVDLGIRVIPIREIIHFDGIQDYRRPTSAERPIVVQTPLGYFCIEGLLDASLDRILSENIVASEDLPEGARSTVDGFAVRAEDTFGASDSLPAFLEVVAAVTMGTMPDFEIHAGQAAQIPTGGFLPRGADAIVMVEYTNSAGSNSIEVTRPVTVRTNVLEKGEDARCGEVLLPPGKRLRSQELGFLASLGITEVSVYRRPRVAIISSGDEVVPINRKPALGQIRDANGHAVAALVRACGGEPFALDIIPDNADLLKEAVQTGLKKADVVALSGGSSVGARDLMVDAVAALPGVEILAHGVAIRPGKPTLLARQAEKAIVGLPGHPVSALVVAQVFLAPLLRYLQGCQLEKGPLGHRVQAALATSIHSTIGLEEYVRVRIEETAEGSLTAHPVFGKSGMLSTMVNADGIILVPMNAEGFSKGKAVEVIQS